VERATTTPPRAWYHTIDLPDGTTTPGYADTRSARRYIEWPAAIAGGRCLDVGTFDGFWAFEMERLGAGEIVALDVDDPAQLDWPYDYRRSGPELSRERQTHGGSGFAHAAAALGSSVQRISLSVYDLDPDLHGRFDVVVVGALLIHLRDPVRALEAIRRVCAGELVVVESIDPLLDLIARRVACARIAPEGDKWWRTNTAGMAALLDRAGFTVAWTSRRFLVPHGPGFGNGRSPLIHALATGRLRPRGGVHRAFRARPRPPADRD
jgi:tRNA (mo5U34)-methyltransferase